jgi:hypothetical protein
VPDPSTSPSGIAPSGIAPSGIAPFDAAQPAEPGAPGVGTGAPAGRRGRSGRPRGGPRPGGRVPAVLAGGMVLLAAAGALAGASLSGGSRAPAPHDRRAAAAGGPAGQTFRVTASGRDYTSRNLAAAVPAIIAAQAAAHPPGAIVPAVLAPFRTPHGLGRCLSVLGQGGPPVSTYAVDLGRFGGRPAAVFVLAEPGQPGKVMVFVEGPGCAAGHDATLFWAAAPRPPAG